MAKGQLNAVLHYLRRPFETRAMAALTDRQLLERFLQTGEEQAFTGMLQRHAAMVLSVAHRVLHNLHDAEDVFQATFLVLAKKAGMIRRRQALAGWLYQVAYHLALRVKAENAQRHAQERRFAIMIHTAPETTCDQDELRAGLDQELNHLPEKYRTPLVLHYLEGKSKRETAEQLGWSEGTVSGRLARARKLLHRRLIRRGFVLSAAGISTLLAENTATAVVSPILLRATVQAGLVFAGSIPVASTISATAARLAEGLAKKMLLAKLKIAATVVLAVTVAVAGVGIATYRALAVKAEKDAPPRDVAAIGQADAPRNKEEAPQKSTAQPAPQDGADNALIHLSASGKVVDTQGGPIAGATIYLREIATSRGTGEIQNQAYSGILAQMTTDANGRFAFKDVSAKPMKPSRIYRHPWSIVITSKGYGMTWHVFH
jgi:RNA polymerase sigma factor (sigma-70 family)